VSPHTRASGKAGSDGGGGHCTRGGDELGVRAAPRLDRRTGRTRATARCSRRSARSSPIFGRCRPRLSPLQAGRAHRRRRRARTGRGPLLLRIPLRPIMHHPVRDAQDCAIFSAHDATNITADLEKTELTKEFWGSNDVDDHSPPFGVLEHYMDRGTQRHGWCSLSHLGW
jgi:hypothetical protein